MKRTLLLMAVVTIPLLAGCGGSALERQVRSRPAPAGEHERTEECAWIRSTMEHEQDVFNREAVFAQGLVAILNRVRLEQALTVLQSRASAARCSGDFRYGNCGWHLLCWTG